MNEIWLQCRMLIRKWLYMDFLPRSLAGWASSWGFSSLPYKWHNNPHSAWGSFRSGEGIAMITIEYTWCIHCTWCTHRMEFLHASNYAIHHLNLQRYSRLWFNGLFAAMACICVHVTVYMYICIALLQTSENKQKLFNCKHFQEKISQH